MCALEAQEELDSRLLEQSHQSLLKNSEYASSDENKSVVNYGERTGAPETNDLIFFMLDGS